ncbi:MAG: hypothetical protein H6772_03150 [Pseudomonadales bacterium]|nr:hypothetical protein [Pseudomonadales bacterium]
MLTLISNSGMLDFNPGNDFMLILIKYMFILGGVIYVLFAFLIIKQVSLMSKTLSTTFSLNNKILGYVHFIASVLVLIYFLLVL